MNIVKKFRDEEHASLFATAARNSLSPTAVIIKKGNSVSIDNIGPDDWQEFMKYVESEMEEAAGPEGGPPGILYDPLD